MYETKAEIAELDILLSTSLRGAGSHLRSIISAPDRTLDAEQLTRLLTGMTTLTVATVTAAGEPRISGVDGHLLHGRWVFTTSGDSAKARHLRARPAVSAAHVVGDDLGVFTHGTAEFLTAASPDFAAVEDHLVGHYGSSPSSWGDDIAYLRIQPHWMVAYAYKKADLLANLSATVTPPR